MSARVIQDHDVPRVVCARGCGRRGIDVWGCPSCETPPLPATARYPGTSTALPDEAYDRLAAHERSRRRPARAMPTPERLQTIAARLDEQGLRPVIDPDLAMVVCDCPRCHAQDGDPIGLYRPLRAVPRGETITLSCWTCGAEREVRHV